MAILGKRASLLIEETALLRDRDVDAAGESHVALIIEERAVGLVHRQQSGRTGRVEADRRPTEIQKIGGPKRDVVLLVAVLDGELAGHGQQIGVGQEVGCVVVVVADARKHADAPFVALRVVPCVLERVLGEFEKDALLRIHDLGFERIDAKEGGIKKIRALDQTASADVVRIVAKMFVNAGPSSSGVKKEIDSTELQRLRQS